jgi:type IX secretion system PorP/SprF family membrane protein
MKFFQSIVIFTFAQTVLAQDPIFTQYFLVPETINPGFTGVLDTWHAGIIHRTQWPNQDYRIDTQYAFVNTAANDYVGVGLNVRNHRERFTDYNFLQINGVFAYKVELNDDWSFRPGLEAGFGQKTYGFGGLLLEDQINVNTGAISNTSVDPGVIDFSNKIEFFDFSVGFIIDKEDAWFGAALKHLNRPDISFTENGNVPLEMFLSAHGGYTFNIYNTNLMWLPEETKLLLTANYMMQSEYNRLDLGSALVFEQFTFGVTAATNPLRNSGNSHFLTSINPFGSIQFDHFIFGYSYDLNTSRFGNNRGVFELSLTWQLDFFHKCFGCPNYQVEYRSKGRSGYRRKFW